MIAKIWTQENPFRSSQVVVQDRSWSVYFHKNTSIETWKEKLTLFGGKEKSIDRGDLLITAIRELAETSEASLCLAIDRLVPICQDGPMRFEKWWFFSQIYYLLISSNEVQKITHAEIFTSLWDLESRGQNFQWGTSLEHTKKLVHRALEVCQNI